MEPVQKTFRICGIYEGDKLLYLGKTETHPSRWSWNIKKSYKTEIGKYLRQNKDKTFRVRTIKSYQRSGIRDNAFKEYYYDLNPVFPNYAIPHKN